MSLRSFLARLSVIRNPDQRRGTNIELVAKLFVFVIVQTIMEAKSDETINLVPRATREFK